MNLLVFLNLPLYLEFPLCSHYKSNAFLSVLIKVLFYVVTWDLMAGHSSTCSDPQR